jgi:hypothetical protein
MKSGLIGTMVLLFLTLSSEIALAQDLASQLVGVWKQTGAVDKYVESGAMRNRGPGGVAIFSRGGFFSHTFDKTGVFSSGTYKVQGDAVVLRVEMSSLPQLIGEERRPTMKIVDGVLTWTGAQVKDWDGKAFNAIFTLERLE